MHLFKAISLKVELFSTVFFPYSEHNEHLLGTLSNTRNYNTIYKIIWNLLPMMIN